MLLKESFFVHKSQVSSEDDAHANDGFYGHLCILMMGIYTIKPILSVYIQ